MLSVYGYEQPDGTWTIFDSNTNLPEAISSKLIPIIVPEEGSKSGAVLKKNQISGLFYWEPIPVEPPVIPPETIEEKMNNLFNMTEQNNLITVDAVLGVYEEVLALREEVAALKEITNNA